MMREFLESYGHAVNLDSEQYNCYFPPKVKRSAFLLFDKQIICEFKELQNVDVKSKVEKVSLNENISERTLKDNLYKRIERCLSDANKQINHTKTALDFQDSSGLIILENLMLNDLSVVALIDAADRKMLKGLIHIDCVLCLDFVNIFTDIKGKPNTCAQTVLRSTEKAERLCELLDSVDDGFLQ